MSRFKLYNTLTADPRESDDLRSILRMTSRISLEALNTIEKDGKLYLDTDYLRRSIQLVRDYELQGHSFEDAVDNIALQIESLPRKD